MYPAPLILNGVTLPWKEKAVHLGHILQQDLTFDADAAARRAAFISRSVDVREQFSFAPPAQVLKAVRILCCHGYGGVLWRLDGTSATSYFKAYNSCIKRVFTKQEGDPEYSRNLAAAVYKGLLSIQNVDSPKVKFWVSSNDLLKVPGARQYLEDQLDSQAVAARLLLFGKYYAVRCIRTMCLPVWVAAAVVADG